MAIEVDNLFQALDIIIDDRLKQVSYDTTDICIIVDDSNAKNGKYWVSPNNGETKYLAYSESDEYKKDESVRVSIPNGDFTQKKFIVGKYVVDDAITPMTYVSPLNTVIDVTGNLLSSNKQIAQFGLITNGTVSQIPIWSADLALDESYKDLQASGIYNTITLSAQFKTLLDNYDMRSGSYGLRLDVYVKINPESDKFIVRSVYLDSSEMFGDPYGFIIYSSQAKKFDLSQIGAVEKLSLWFYQNGDFSYFNNAERCKEAINAQFIYKENILLRNVNIAFGSDLAVIADNTIQAYTTDSTDYRISVTDADNEKRIGFLWYNKDANNQYVGFNDGIVDFETDEDGNIVQVNKLTKDWKHATRNILDINGKPMQEFVRDEDGKVVLVPQRNDNDEIIVVDNLSREKSALQAECDLLRETLLDEEILSTVEYSRLSTDIDDYQTEKRTYLNTDHIDEAATATALETYNYNLETLRAQLEAGDISQWDYDRSVESIKQVYDDTIKSIRDYRIKMTYVIRNQTEEIFVPKIQHYDEIAYLNESEADARLVAQSGRENIASDKKSLTLAANLADAKPILDKTCDLVTKDLVKVFREMQNRMTAISEVTSKFDTILITPKEDYEGRFDPDASSNLQAWWSTVNKLKTELYDVYERFLAYNYRVQENQKKLPAERKDITFLTADASLEKWLETKHDLYQVILDKFNTVLTPMVNTFFTEIQVAITGNYDGYQGVYDTYFNKAQKVIDTITANLDKLTLLLGDSNDIMLTMPPCLQDNNYIYVNYNKQDFSNYDNRYSIYWYRYQPGYKSEDRFIASEWKRLTTKADFGIDNSEDIANKELALEALAQQKENDNEFSEEEYAIQKQAILDNFYASQQVYNFGLPIYDEFILKDGKYYFSAKALDTNTLASRVMDGTKEQEKYKVILFYNHEMFESKELVFTNLDDVVDPTTLDKTDAIVINHEDNSQDTYQSYGLNNFLVNAADASKVRTVSVHYNGILAGDEALAEAQVYWYIPDSGTMLTCDDGHLTKNLGFFSDKNIAEDQKPDYSRQGYTCYYKTIGTDIITIEDDPDTEDVNESDEKITALASDLTFTYKIKDYYMATASRNELICKIVKGEYEFETSILFAFTSLGTSGTDYTLAITPQTTQVAVYPGTPLLLDVVLYDYNNDIIPISESLIGEMNGASDFKLEWEGPTSYQSTHETSADNGMIATIHNVTGPQENDSLIYGVLKASVNCPIKKPTVNEEDDIFGDSAEDKESGVKASTRNVTLTSYYPIPWSANGGNYYIEGATTVIYDSMGSNPTYYKDPYKIYTCNTNENLADIKQVDEDGNIIDSPKYDIKWRIVYYKLGENNTVIKLNKETHPDYNLCRNYMPILNEKNGLNPASMHIDDMKCWCAVECWIKDLSLEEDDPLRKYSLIWVQPIMILKNRYPSPMLNSWDGTLTVDKKNGTILSSLVGAGRKTRNNTFEGVLMGDIEGSADIYDADNKSGLGIYGFNDGAQSFGFNADGTGFIGKSGRGRIKFNGSEGTIESASYTSGQHPFGMKIDFDDGLIDMKGGIEYTDQDWINLIIDKYKSVLGQRKKVYDEVSKTYKESLTEYIVDLNVVPKEVQQDLLAKIEYDSQYLNILYNEELNTIWDSVESSTERSQLLEQLNKKVDENKYYALSTLKNAKRKGKFQITKQVDPDGASQLVEHEFTVAQYNAIVNELDEAILAETYDGEAISKDLNYKNRYGTLSKALESQTTQLQTITDEAGKIVSEQEETITTQSHIHVDVKSPYFYIISEQGKRIINIGDNTEFNFSDYPYSIDENNNIIFKGTQRQKSEWLEPYGSNLSNGYYLKSNDFSYTNFNTTDNAINTDGSGFLLDLTNGHINAFNLSIASKNIFIDSSKGANPFFVIKDDHGHNLLYAGADEYYLKTCNYSARDIKDDGTIAFGSGMKIDLKENQIDAYNFMLRGEQNDGDYAGSYLQLSSDPKLIVHLKNSQYDLDILHIDKEQFLLQSNNWNSNIDEVEETDVLFGHLVGVTLNQRKGPGTDYDIADAALGPDIEVRIYGEENGWYSIAPGNNKNTDDARWVSKIYNGKNVWETVRKDVTTESGTASGAQFDIYEGKIEMNNGNTQSLLIDSKHATYPLQLGIVNNTGLRNFRVGWDGSLYGGSDRPWSIDAKGNAKFSYLSAYGGSLHSISLTDITAENATLTKVVVHDATIEDGKIGGLTIALNKGILGGNWAFTDQGLLRGQQPLGTCNVYNKLNVSTTNSLTFTGSMTVYVNGEPYLATFEANDITVSQNICTGVSFDLDSQALALTCGSSSGSDGPTEFG